MLEPERLVATMDAFHDHRSIPMLAAYRDIAAAPGVRIGTIAAGPVARAIEIVIRAIAVIPVPYSDGDAGAANVESLRKGGRRKSHTSSRGETEQHSSHGFLLGCLQ